MCGTIRDGWTLVLASLLLLLFSGVAAAQDLNVGGYSMESRTRVSRFEFVYTYRAQVINSGPAVRNVSASLTVHAPGVTVLDGDISVGDVAANSTRTSSDTFSLRHNRLHSFAETDLIWDVAFEPVAQNIPPVAHAGQDQVHVLPEDAETIQVLLDGSGSEDSDGTLSEYRWSGMPDPDDSVDPWVTLGAGSHSFTLVVTDDEGAESLEDSVTVTVLRTPLLIAPPAVTSDPSVRLRGLSTPGARVIVRGGADDVVGEPLPDSDRFEITVNLLTGPNELRVFTEWNGVESEPASAMVVREEAPPVLVLSEIAPETGQSGAILTLTGQGFTPDRDLMGVWFRGALREGAGGVIVATETSIQVAVPFVFLNSDEVVDVYVFDDTRMSNTLSFHVGPAGDPTPALSGNELSGQLERLLAVTDRTITKSTQLLKPYVTEEEWAPVEENLQRIQTFLEGVRGELLTVQSPEGLAKLDAIFGSEVFAYANDRLAEVDSLLSHSPYSEAACVVSKVLGILTDVIDVLDIISDILFGAEIACAFVPPCWPVIGIIETARQIVDRVLDTLRTIRDILGTAVPSEPTDWKIGVTGPYPHIGNRILYTNTDNKLTLWVDFTNGGSTRIAGSVSGFAGWLLELLDIELPAVRVEDVKIKSTVEIIGGTPPGLSVVENAAKDDHDIMTHSGQGVVDLKVRGRCPPYEYPDETGGETYPELHKLEVIDKPRAENLWWDDEYSVWRVEGKGFGDQCGSGFRVYWNDELVDCDNVRALTHNSFYLQGNQFREAGRISFAVLDGDQRLAEPVRIGPARYEDLDLFAPLPAVAQVGELVTVTGEGLSPYVSDTTLRFYVDGELIVTTRPVEISVQPPWVGDDSLTFQVPSELIGHENRTVQVEAEVAVSDIVTGVGGTSDSVYFGLRFAESAEAGDQDLIVFGTGSAYLRTAHIADLDGDGENDLIVGLPESRSPRGVDWVVVGSVHIAFGPVEGNLLPDGTQYIDLSKVGLSGELKENWDVVILGSVSNYDAASGHSRRIGNAIASGDINGDGIADLIIGSTDQDEADAHTYNTAAPSGLAHIPGKAFVFYGRHRAHWLQNNGLWTAESSHYDLRIHGDDQRELGYQVAVGDLNDDGFGDVIIGAPTDALDSTVANDLVAHTYVVFGGDSLPAEIDVETSADVVITGQDVDQSASSFRYKGDGLGKGLATGDIDNDGVDDLLVGAPEYLIRHGPGPEYRYNIGSFRQGAVFAFYGGTGLRTDYTVGPYGDQDALILGPSTITGDPDLSKPIGRAIALADLSDDGAQEVAIGRLDRGVYVGRGTNIPASGIISIDDMYDVVFEDGADSSWRIGTAVASGDITGDGILDLLVGAPTRDEGSLSLVPGRVWVVAGEASPQWLSGAPELLQLNDYIDAPQDAIVHSMLFIGEQGGIGFGTFVTAGDLAPYEGDDLLVVDPRADVQEPPPETGMHDDAGLLYVFYEGSNVLRTHTEPQSIEIGDTVSGVIGGIGFEGAWEWFCTGETLSVATNLTGVAGPDLVHAYMYDPYHMILAEGLTMTDVETPDGGPCGILIRSGVEGEVGYEFTVDVSLPGPAIPLILNTSLPYVSPRYPDALIELLLNYVGHDVIEVYDWDSLNGGYVLRVNPISTEAADFSTFSSNWELVRSHENPVPEDVSPSFIIGNPNNGRYYKLIIGFTVLESGAVSINSVVGWDCGEDPMDCPN